MNRKIVCLIVLATACLWTPRLTAQDPSPEPNDATTEIQSAIDAYIAAFNAKDAATLVSLWSDEGVYSRRDNGEQIQGREAMLEAFTEIFSGEAVPTLAVTTESIEFVSPNVALERGIAIVTHSAEDVSETSYSAVYVKREGVWLLDRVTEEELVLVPSLVEKLQPLEWLIGEFVDDTGEGVVIEYNGQWTKNQNFISRTYKVMSDDEVTSSGLQIIGWDPVNEGIRSWLFDSDGSFVSGEWTFHDEQWVVQSKATLADGAQGSFTSVYELTEDGNHTWKKVNRVLDGELLPSIDEVLIRRK